MGWFDEVPDRISIAGGLHFLPAQEALWDSEPGDEEDWRDRPTDDFAAAAVLMVARLQLDQMIEVLKGSPLLRAAQGRWVEALSQVRVVGDGQNPDGRGDPDDDLSCVQEAIPLWESLQGRIGVGHGFAVDGSISITTGPDIPECPMLGLQGSDDGELNDSPLAVLRASIEATRAAARIITGLGYEDGATVSRRRYP